MLQTPISEITAQLTDMFSRTSLADGGGDPTAAPSPDGTNTPAPKPDAGQKTAPPPASTLDEVALKLSTAIGEWEHRDNDDPSTYTTVNPIGAMGRYQFMPGTLRDDSIKYFGREVTPAEFLSNPALQDQLMLARTKDRLSQHLEESDGDLNEALRQTALDHIGRNGGHLDAPAMHNGKVVGESPNEYAAEVLKRFGKAAPSGVSDSVEQDAPPQDGGATAPVGFPSTPAPFPGQQDATTTPATPPVAPPDLGYAAQVQSGLAEQSQAGALARANQAIEAQQAEADYQKQFGLRDQLLADQQQYGITPVTPPAQAESELRIPQPGISEDEERLKELGATRVLGLPADVQLAALRMGHEIAEPFMEVGEAASKAGVPNETFDRAYGEFKDLGPKLQSSSRVLNTLADIGAGSMKTVAAVETGNALGLSMGTSMAGAEALGEATDYASGEKEATPGNLVKSLAHVAIAKITGDAFGPVSEAGGEVGQSIAEAAAAARVPVASNLPLMSKLGRVGAAIALGDVSTQTGAAVEGHTASDEDRLVGAASLLPFEALSLPRDLSESVGAVESGGEDVSPDQVQTEPQTASPHEPYSPGRYVTDEPLVSHSIENGPNKGSVTNGVIARDLGSLSEARAIDPYAFAKNDGYFIHQKHVARPEGYIEQTPADIIAGVEARRGTSTTQPTDDNANTSGIGPRDEVQEHQGDNDVVRTDGNDRDVETAEQGSGAPPGDSNSGGPRETFQASAPDAGAPEEVTAPQTESPTRVFADRSAPPTAPEQPIYKALPKTAPAERPDFSEFDDAKYGPQPGPGLKDIREMNPSERKAFAKDALDKSVVGRAIDWWQRKLAPQTMSEGAQTTALDIRAAEGRRMQQAKITDEAIKDAHQYMSNMTRSQAAEFMYDADYGLPHADPKLQQARTLFDNLFTAARDRLHAVSPEALKTFYENYFPHVWKDPVKAKAYYSDPARMQRLLKGDKSFMKQRYYADMYEGLKAGLEPASWNPADMVRTKLASINRFIAGEEISNSLADRAGTRVFIPNRQGVTVPEGYTLDKSDPNFTVYGRVQHTVTEAIDQNLHDQLDAFTKTLEPDIQMGREVNLKKTGARTGVVGGYVRTLGERGNRMSSVIKTLFGSGDGVKVHEVGHVMDNKFDLYNKVVGGDPLLRHEAEELALQRVKSTGGHASDKYLAYLQSPEEQMANLAHAYVMAPDLLNEVAPHLADKFDKVLQSVPELNAFRYIKPGVEIGFHTQDARDPTRIVRGWYAIRDGEYQVLKNYLSPGLAGKSIAFDALRAYNNTASMAKLSLSAFHGFETAYNSVINDLGRAMVLGFKGRFDESAQALKDSFNLKKKFREGQQFLKAYAAPGSEGEYLDTVVNRAVLGGFQGGKDPYYDSRMRQKFREAIGNNAPGLANTLGATAKALGKGELLKPGVAAKGLMAALEQAAAPIMDYWVPAMKAAAVKQLVLDDLADADHPVTSEADIKKMTAKAVDHVDNIFGQVIYSNLFWDRAVKDKLLQTFLATGWNFGTARAFTGSLVDAARTAHNLWEGNNPELTQRTAYMLALTMTHAFTAALITGLLAHHAPKDVKDLILPSSGDVDDLGDERRLSIKDYFTDLYSTYKDPKGTIIGKLAPVFSTVATLLTNKGHYGDNVVNPDDPFWRQWVDRGLYVASDFIPFTATAIRNELEEGTHNKLAVTAGAFIGIKPARRELYQTDAEAVQQRYTQARYTEGGRTQETAEHSSHKSELLRLLRNGEAGQAAALRDRYIKEGKITPSDWKTITKESKESGFTHDFKSDSPDQALRVFEAASPAEREVLLPTLRDKIRRLSDENTDPKMLKEYRDRFQRLAAGVPSRGATRVLVPTP